MKAKPRILFVDDEPNILQALQRMLHFERCEWDLAYASGSIEALQMLDKAAVDIIVTDMRMPTMNGAELLETVRAQHPDTVRLALSGHTDRELIFRAVSPTHQFLSKPCDLSTLKNTIARCIEARSLLGKSAVRALIGSLTSVPSLLDAYEDFHDKMECGEGNIVRIGKIVGLDIGLSAKCLQLVNSAFFGTPRRIQAPECAAQIMGIEALRDTFLQPGVDSVFPSDRMRNLDPSQLLEHSRLAKRIALRIAHAAEFAPQVAESAGLAAFLHDIGKLILAAQRPERYDAFLYWSGSKCRFMEQAEFGAAHGKIGAYLLGLWGFDADVVEAVAWHHTPREAAYGGSPVLAVVYVANILAHQNAQAADCDDHWDLEYLEMAGMIDKIAIWQKLVAGTVENGGNT